MGPSPRLCLACLLGALVLLTCQCSLLQRPEPKLRGLSSREASSLSDAYSPQEDSKAKDGPVQEMPPERREAMANMLLRSRDYESSLMNYLQVLRVQPDRMDIRYKVGVIYLLGGRYDAARQELEKVVLAKPDMLEAREALALVNVQEKRFPQALEAFRAVLRQDGQRAQTRYFLGAALLASGQPREAVTELETAIRLDPKNVAAMSSLGEAYVQLKDYPKAVAWLKKALAVDAQHQKSNHQLGMALAGLKRYDEAFQAFLKAGDEAQAYNNIGVHYYLDGRYEDAAKCFQKALELRPTYYDEAKVNLNRALEKLHQHQPKEAP